MEPHRIALGIGFWIVLPSLIWPETVGMFYLTMAGIAALAVTGFMLAGYLLAGAFALTLAGLGTLFGWMIERISFRLGKPRKQTQKEKVAGANKQTKSPPHGEQKTDKPAPEDELKRARERIKLERQKRERAEQELRDAHARASRQAPPKDWRVASKSDALLILDLSEPYTQAELKTRWRSMLKQTHPDQGGSNMMLRLVNEAYERLKT